MSESTQSLDSIDLIKCEPEKELNPKEDHEEEEVDEDEDGEDEDGEHQLGKPWPICGIPEEREMSPDEEGDDEVQSSLPIQDDLSGLINNREMIIERRESTVKTIQEDSINLPQLDSSPQPDIFNQDNALESNRRLVNDDPIKPEPNDSELFDEPISTLNPFNKLHSSTHIDSSTVAISPAFQALPNHIPSHFYATRSHPWNRSGFRYLACGPPRSDEQNDLNPINDRYPVYHAIETIPQGQVKWAWEDRSNYVYITKDGLAVTTDRGFRSARANLPIRQGRFYFEIILDRAGGEPNPGSRSEPEHAHVRIGLARRESGLNAPVGIDGYSYGIRDKTGEKVHLSKLESYGSPFTSGDVIGVYVDLPTMRSPNPNDPHDPARIERRRIPIRYRRQLYFESPEYPISKEMEDLADAASPSKLKPKPQFRSTLPPPPAVKKPVPGQKPMATPIPTSHIEPTGIIQRDLPVLKGSKLAFFKNGVCQGVAFQDLLDFLPLKAYTSSSQDRLNSNLVTNLTDSTSLEPLTANREHLHDDGTLGYYPCVSVYGGGIARLNPGPEFKYPPPEDIEACLDRTDSMKAEPQSVLPDESNQINHSVSSTSTSQKWQALSELYPIYLAEQNQLDKLDAMEFQRRLNEEMKLVEIAKETKARKRRRVPSPSSRPVSPTSSSNQSPTTGILKGPKAKKKSKILNHSNVMSSDGSKSQTFKPSPLGVMEMYDDCLSTHEAGIGLNEIRPESSSSPGFQTSKPSSRLGHEQVSVLDSLPASHLKMNTLALDGHSPPAIRDDDDSETTYLATPADHSNPHLAPIPPSITETSTIDSSSISKPTLEKEINLKPSLMEPIEPEAHQKLDLGISNEPLVITNPLETSPQVSLETGVNPIRSITTPDLPSETNECNVPSLDQAIEPPNSMNVEAKGKSLESPIVTTPQVSILETHESDLNRNPSDVPLVKHQTIVPQLNSSNSSMNLTEPLTDLKSESELLPTESSLSNRKLEILNENHMDPKFNFV
ncbi:hypothetical protein DFH28DRAFT_933341 [Melampsora americana]|nr:hypothetical protein DFH28DRAFT_933341 [Melampsora americana]